jgi:hypothetical protein
VPNVLANLARVASSTTGTGTLTLGSAVTGCLTFADAGVTNGAVVTYAVEDYDGSGNIIAREIGVGTYSTTGPTLSRDTVYASTNAGSKINCSGLQHVFVTAAKQDFDTFALASAVRQKLTANRTYYVRTDGSDSNTGLTDSAGGAFLTIQAAVNAFYALDVGGFVVTIQVRDGTYTGQVRLTGQPPGCTATDPLILQGNLGTPANVVIQTTNANLLNVTSGAELLLQGFKLSTTTDGICILSQDHARVYVQSCEFGACASAHLEAKDAGEITVANNYTISGSAVSHMHVTTNGFIFYGGGTITLAGTPAFSAYFIGLNNAHAQFGTTTFSGAATGRRFYVHNNASIYTNGSYSATYFPGDVAGILAGGSCIDDYDGTHVLSNTGLQIDDTDASHQLTIKPGSNLSADRIFTLTTGDAARTLDISAADVTVSSFGATLVDDANNTAARTTLGLGTAATQNTGTSGANIPLLNASNFWTGYQQINITQDFGAALILQSTQDSANEGPFLQFKRVSANPADNDRVGSFSFTGLNTALAERTLAQFGVYMTNATEASLASLMVFKTYFSGSFTDRFYLKGAFYSAGVTGGDTGVGTINATTLYEAGVSLAAKYQPLDGDLTALAALSGTNTIYYRSASNTWTAVTIGANLTFSGGTLAATGGGTLGDGDYGDITVSVSGTVLTIDNDAVTYAKMQNAGANTVLTRAAGTSGDIGETSLAASQLLGRGATGDIAAITLGTNLSMSGATLNATGGGGASATTVEVDLGSPKFTGKFTITDAAITATSKILCWQAPGPYTGKGTRADEAEMQPVEIISVEPATGSAVVKWQTPPAYGVKVELQEGQRRNTVGATFDRVLNQLLPIAFSQVRLGKVRGNVKFSYTVFS